MTATCILSLYCCSSYICHVIYNIYDIYEWATILIHTGMLKGCVTWWWSVVDAAVLASQNCGEAYVVFISLLGYSLVDTS